MPKTKISEFDSTPANNTDIDGINIAEGCAPSGINNAIRELMSQLKDQQTGASADNFTVGGNLAVTGTSTFTGIPSGPTASAGTNTTQLATTAFVIASSPIPVGSVILFYQSAAPTGWTQVTTQNNKALRVVSGTGGVSGGTTAFSSVFTNQTVSTSVSISGTSGATTLSTSQIPSHNHETGDGTGQNTFAGLYTGNPNNEYVGSTGGGGSHTHSFSGSGSGTSSAVTLNVQYIDIILCSKN
jgi:hypothetical protein